MTTGLAMALAGLLVLGVTAPSASPPPEVPAPGAAPRFRFTEHLNRHSTMGFSTDRWTRSEVVLHRLADGAVRVEDAGEDGDSSADRTWGYSAEKTRWRNTWTGTWKATDGGALLTLTLATRACATTVIRDREADRTTACPAGATALRLECRRSRVRLGPALADEAAKKPYDVWDCALTGSAPDVTGTPGPWTFGEAVCVEAGRPTRGGRTPHLCDEEAQPAPEVPTATEPAR